MNFAAVNQYSWVNHCSQSLCLHSKLFILPWQQRMFDITYEKLPCMPHPWLRHNAFIFFIADVRTMNSTCSTQDILYRTLRSSALIPSTWNSILWSSTWVLLSTVLHMTSASFGSTWTFTSAIFSRLHLVQHDAFLRWSSNSFFQLNLGFVKDFLSSCWWKSFFT